MSYFNIKPILSLISSFDKLASINSDALRKHYVLVDNYCLNKKCLAIRIPGGTLGGIWFDDNDVIIKIKVDTNYVVKSYTSDVNEQIQKFVGQKIEF